MSATEKWAGMPMLGFDLESSGVNVHTDRIVTAALVDIGHGRPKIDTWLADPGISIPAEAAAVHGITTEHARQHGRPIDQVLFEVTGRLALALGHGIPVVTMNGSFDLSMLEAENRRHGLPTLVDRLDHSSKIRPIIDVLVLDKHADPYRKGGRRLEHLCQTYGVTHTGAHDAAGDALAVCRIWPRLMAKHATKFRGMTLGGLHQGQVGWRREQMDSLRSYFDRQGTVHDGCCGAWPVHGPCCAPVEAVAQ